MAIISKTTWSRGGPSRIRKYCTKCGLTWYTENPKERCPDCNKPKKDKD